ncbi:hypothetical protein C2S51_026857 [Perilla frutescens var. frutescens]|nr:hypothetical protein C2S51_026857 [Perilla frutescens var. frutescens]
MIWLQSLPTEALYFYDIKCSESFFSETIVVELKHSLSIALKHFLPLAGKIIFPLTSASMPISRYISGDSVALTIALSDSDFTNLKGNHSRTADEFHEFVSQLPPAVYSSDDIKFSALAIQVTFFPNQGICIGFTYRHTICDAGGFFAFVHAWASINKLNGDAHLDGNILPFYDRSRVQDANKLTTITWDRIKTSRPTVSLIIPLPLHKVRATFILTNAQIEKLRNFAMIKKPAMARVSSFVVVCAHVWSCLAKSAGEEVADDEPEYLTSPVDCRARLHPPLPETYFGNCLVFLRADSTHGRLKGNEGFVAAVEAIVAAIGRIVDSGGGILDGFENQLERDSELIGKRWVPIAGSPRIDHYGGDYGWGSTLSKYEYIHIDFDGAVNLCKARDGGVEIGLSMPMLKMDAFASQFNKNLLINSNL